MSVKSSVEVLMKQHVKWSLCLLFSCPDLNFFCKGNGGEDDVSMPCSGVKLDLFSDEDDYCGWCSASCIETLKVSTFHMHHDIIRNM